MTHAEMLSVLVERFGLQCWGCNFVAPNSRYLHLDHISPKSEGGSNDLDNRAPLCQVCNLDKSNTMTLTQLRRKKAQEQLLSGQHPINLPDARAWARAYQQERERQTPQQLSLASPG